MRDCYVGDIGDFAKYGLLRAISKVKRLGVAWYLCVEPEVRTRNDVGVDPNNANNGDGRHTAYLQRRDEWRQLDCDLFDTLKNLIDEKRRSVAEIEKSGILGTADFAGEPIDVTHVPVRERTSWRCAWFERVQNALSACDLVFADPDNGLYPDEKFKPTRKENAKRIPLYEALALAEGRTTVIYHHNSMKRGGHTLEIQNWMSRLPGRTYAWYWRRWSNRTFFLLNPDSEIEDLIEDFAQRWSECGELLRSESKSRHLDPSGTDSRSAQNDKPNSARALPRDITKERILERLMRQYDQPIMNNVQRGNFVECMIAYTLGPDWQLTWEAGWDWAPWDCEHITSGARLEIKQAAARQSWDRKAETPRRKPSFDIAPRSGFWPKDGGPWVPRVGRHADLYVFAWHEFADEEADQRNPEQWQFFAIAANDLPVRKKSIGLGRLREIVKPCGIGGIRSAVAQIADAQGVKQGS